MMMLVIFFSYELYLYYSLYITRNNDIITHTLKKTEIKKMTMENVVINKDYSFNLTDRARDKRISSEHGIIKLAIKLSYYCNRESQEGCGFKKAWKSFKNAGWSANYTKAEIEAIYTDVCENAYFIDSEKVDFKRHVVAVL